LRRERALRKQALEREREALEQQTATSDILRVISSSPTDVQPVFDAIVRSSVPLCDAESSNLQRFDGERMHLVAAHNFQSEAYTEFSRLFPMRPERKWIGCRAVLDQAVVHVADLFEEQEFPAHLARKSGWRCVLAVPMLREGLPVGAIVVARTRPVLFSEKQIALLRTFADQAVIAIENARLFNETKEALERQTATAEILKVISRSPSDTQPVFQAIVDRAAELFQPCGSGLVMREGDFVHLKATAGPDVSDERDEQMRAIFPLPFNPDAVLVARIIAERRITEVLDTEAAGLPERVSLSALSVGYRSITHVPLFHYGIGIGVIVLTHPQPGFKLTQKQLALVETFADQAVIAIENARLFNETKEALERQTAMSEVLSVISRTTTDLGPVLQTVLDNARRLCNAERVQIFRPNENGEYVTVAASGEIGPASLAVLQKKPIQVDRSSATGRALIEGRTVHIPDVQADPEYGRHDIAHAGGYRTILAVPLLREGAPVGVLTVARAGEPRPYTDKQLELVTTFADQAVIAIENVRLFNEIQEKTRQLEVASQHKSQFLASMSHELRTPLNALLGFNEMILGHIYGEVPADMKPPLTQMQASGKHLLRLINNVLDLAKIEAGRMELALSDYSVHDAVEGVRSTLQPLATEKGLDFTAAVPEDIPVAYGDAGRITQCLMNLAGNALKFTKAGRVEISVARNGGSLRYCVADSGVGIPREKIEALFTEFKQTDATIASEYGGTGLGLSITKKFVEMHGGRIWVDSEPGRGSMFTFEVPLRVPVEKAA